MSAIKHDEGKLDLSVFGTNFHDFHTSFSIEHSANLLPERVSGFVDLFWVSYQVRGLYRPMFLWRALCAVPDDVKLEAIEVFQFGAEKYGRLNYAHGLEPHRLVAAFRRHYWYYPVVKGEELDSDSGKSHRAHAACCILMLLSSGHVDDSTSEA